MKKGLLALAVLGVLVLTVGAQAQIYNLEVTTSYAAGTPAGNIGAYSGSPDTSYVTITNNGLTTFTGTISDAAGGYSQTFSSQTLAPGASVVFTTSPESSNVGGFGANGIEILLNGLINGTLAVNLSVYDSQIHSGTVRVSPCDGLSTDAFVLQGGSPTGCDNGDAFEETQASGHYTFTNGTNAVPEPASLALLGSGLIGLAGSIRKRLM